MSTAILYFCLSEHKMIRLYVGSLEVIDTITSIYADEDDLRNRSRFREQIEEAIRLYQPNFTKSNPGRIIVRHLEQDINGVKGEELPVLYGYKTPIATKFDVLDIGKKPDLEIFRKYLLSSQNNEFLRYALNLEWFHDTIGSFVRVNPREARRLIDSGMELYTDDTGCYATIEQIFEYRLKTNKLGPMRDLFEDTLEYWKNELEKLPRTTQYYYSRNARIAVNSFKDSMQERRQVVHFVHNSKVIETIENSKVLCSPYIGNECVFPGRSKTINLNAA